MAKKKSPKVFGKSFKQERSVQSEIEVPEPSLVPEPDVVDLPEADADAIIDEAAAEEAKKQKKMESELDGQYWSRNDPEIPEALKDQVWVAVYRCSEGHKTKATNRQAKSGVRCWKCKESGLTVKAEVMPQFLDKPESLDPDTEKRHKARKGAE